MEIIVNDKVYKSERALEQLMCRDEPIRYTDGTVKCFSRAVTVKKQEITFDYLYDLWVKLTSNTNIDKPIDFKKIYIDAIGCVYNIYGHDWLENYMVKWYTEEDSSQRLATLIINGSKHGTRKGDVDTLNVIANESDNKNRAAIWIAAYICEEFRRCGYEGVSREVYKVCINQLGYKPWNNMQKAWIPKYYVEDIDKRNAPPEDIVEATVKTIKNLLDECTPVLFTSREEDKDK